MVEGGTLQITVLDSDLDTNPSVIYSISDRYILVTTSKDSEKERVSLTKSTSTGATGLFVGLLPTTVSTVRGKDYSGTLNAVAGDFLTVQYFDDAPIGTAVVNIQVATTGQLSKNPYLAWIGNTITLTVYDLDLNANPSIVEAASIQIEKQPSLIGSNPLINLEVQETGANTATFTALLLPVFGAPSAGQLGFCEASDVLTVTYFDM